MRVEINLYTDQASKDLFSASNTPSRQKQYIDRDFSFLSDYETVRSVIDVTSELPLLKMKENSKSFDVDNAINLFKSLGTLNIDFALDPRFWIYLTHNTYKDYMLSRWMDNSQKGGGTITDRFFGFYKYGTDRSISRNALARLWWGAKMTVNENDSEMNYYFDHSSDKYQYTKLLFSLQDVHLQLSERTLARDKKIILAILHYGLKKEIEWSKDKIVKITKLVSLQMYNNRLSFLSPEEIYKLFENIIEL
jgi:hypothetical protein